MLNITQQRKLSIIRSAKDCERAARMAYAHRGNATAMGAYWLQVAAGWSRLAFANAAELPGRRHPSSAQQPPHGDGS